MLKINLLKLFAFKKIFVKTILPLGTTYLQKKGWQKFLLTLIF